MARLSLLVCLVAGVWVVPVPRDGDQAGVRFNEVMADPSGPEGNGAGEWIELRHDGTRVVDLEGWVLADEGDGRDRIRVWSGGSGRLEPGGYALICDPEADPPSLALPADVLLLTVDDASLGNGLGAECDRLRLCDERGNIVDTLSWSEPIAEGISRERAGGRPGSSSQIGGLRWRPCRAPAGSTPGRVNSWTPIPGDRSLRLTGAVPSPARAGEACTLIASLVDEGQAGLDPLHLSVRTWLPDERGEKSENERWSGTLAPGDSVRITWLWTPPEGGLWKVRAAIESPPAERSWWDADTLDLAVRFAPLVRIVTEAQPRPVSGWEEWFEIGPGPGSVARSAPSWVGWRVRVGSVSGAAWAPREYQLTPPAAALVLVGAGERVRLPAAAPLAELRAPTELWPGLRLTDTGCAVVLIDPFGTVVDSAVIRPAAGLPRGHSWQRWETDLAGWLPNAWGFARSTEAVTPGWLAAQDTLTAGSESDRGFRFQFDHGSDGTITFIWQAGASRLWLEADLYDMSGAGIATVLPRTLVRGRDETRWHPQRAAPVVQAGLYLLVVRAEAAETGRVWTIRRALGVRP